MIVFKDKSIEKIMENIDKILVEILNIISQAGEKVLSYYGKKIEVKNKGNDSPVTIADIESNKILISSLSKYGWPILSEEGEGVPQGYDKLQSKRGCPGTKDNPDRLEADLVWIIDPLDGTKDFIQETGEFTIMLSLVKKNKDGNYRPILGIIYRPVNNTFYYAIEKKGAWIKEGNNTVRKLLVSREKEWRNITMFTSRNHTTDLEWQVVKKLGISKVETYGSSLKACLISAGDAELNFNPAPFTWEWDVCPSDLLIHEAGGKFTDTKGELFNYNKKDPKNHFGYLATNGLIHKDILKEIEALKS